MRPLTFLIGILAVAAMVAAAAEVSSTTQLTSQIRQQVVAPGKLLRHDLPKALAEGRDALLDSVTRTDRISEKAWELTIKARESWYATETPEAFSAYVSAVEALLAVDNLAMVPRTGETGYLAAADRHLVASEAADKGAATAADAKQRTAAVASPRTAEAPPPSPATPLDTVYVTNTGSKYHRKGCRHLSNSNIAISRSKAIQQGYTPCKACKP
jgi:hypothetical protein